MQKTFSQPKYHLHRKPGAINSIQPEVFKTVTEPIWFPKQWFSTSPRVFTGDRIVRYGGEEYVNMLPGQGKAEALEEIERF